MAKKNTPLDKLDLDDLGFDDIKMPGEGKGTKKDRKPIEKIATGFADGAKQTFTSKAFIKRTISDALPRGYGTAFNAADSAVQGARELYNSAAQDLRPLDPIVRKATERAMPKVRSYLPKKVADKLDAYAKGGQKFRALSQGEVDNGQMMSEMAGIFKTQMEENARLHQATSTRDMLRQDVLDKRNQKNAFHFAAMRHGIDRLVAYQDQITSKYQQKSLELQYRSYFALRDMLKLQVENSARDKLYLEAIVKNTGLPDILKAKSSEQYGATLRDKLYGRSQQAIVDYVGQFGKRFKGNVANHLRSALSGLSMGVQGAQMAHDTASMMGEFGDDSGMWGMAGNVGGSFAADRFGRKVGRTIRGYANRVGPLKRGGDKLSYFLDAAPERINEWAKSDKGDYGKYGSFVRFIKDLLPRYSAQTGIGESPLNNADEAVSFNAQARRSLVEVIPGFLSRIHHELQIMRTGDSKVQPTVYNLDRGEFTSKGQAAQDVKNRLFNRGSLDMAHMGLNSVLSTIDPRSKLSEGARNALKRQLLSDTTNGRAFDPNRLAYGNDTAELNDSHKAEIAKHFDKHYGTGVGGKLNYARAASSTQAMRSLQSYVSDPTHIAKAYMQTGNRELLDSLGLITRNGMSDHLNMSLVYDLIMGHNPNGGPGPSSTGGSGGGGGGPTPGGSGGPGLKDRVMDLYVQGRQDPALRATVLRAGGYFDAMSGKVIKTVGDIKGPVADQYGNVVLTASEVVNGLRDRHGEDVSKFLQGAVSKAESYMERARGVSASDLKASVLGKLNDWKSRGEELLTKAPSAKAKAKTILTTAGEYFSAKTGEAITSIQQLADGVRDRAGKVVLTPSEAAKVVDDYVGPSVAAPHASAETHAFVTGTPVSQAGPSGGGGGDYNEILELLREMDAHRAEESATQTELLAELIKITAAGGGMGGMDPGKMTRFGLFGRWGGKLAGGIGSGISGAARGLKNYFKFSYGLIGKGIRGTLGLAGGLTGGLREALTDVYVAGQRQPALYAKKMRNGDYSDRATGKPVRSIRDIKGEVVDEQGNVVLTAEDYSKGLYDSRGRKLSRSLFGGAFKLLGAFGSYYGAVVKLPFTAAAMAGRVVKGMRDFANRAQDVYVDGEFKSPRLYATVMKAGGYFDRRSGKQINKPRDIAGEVVDKDGNILISMDDLKKGLVNVHGKPFRTLAQKLLGVVGGVGRFAGKLVGGYFKAAGAFMGMGFDAFAGLFKRLGGIFNPKVFEVYTSKSTKLLEKIFNVLDERLPASEHVRAGSWQDQLKKKASGMRGSSGNAAAGTGAAGGGLLAWLKGKFGRKADEEDEDHDGDTNIDIGGDAEKAIKKGTWGRNTKAWLRRMGRKLGRSRLGRLASRLGGRIANSRLGGAVGRIASRIGGSRLGGLAGRALGGVGRIGGGLLRAGGGLLRGGLALAGLGEGAGALSAIGGGLSTVAGGIGTAAAATGGAIATGASAVGGALAAGASAIGGMISAPVVLGAAAIAAIGYGAYKGYQYYNLKKSQPLRKVRMAQYGVDLNQSVWPMQKILELEDKLKDNVSIGPTGGSISTKDFAPENLFKIFGLDPAWYNPTGWFHHADEEDGKKHLALMNWFNNRFKPVFIQWMVAKKANADKVDFTDLDDKADAASKKKILDAAQTVDSNIYSLMDSPFGDDPLTATADTVNAAFKEAKVAIDAEVAKDGKGKKDAMAVVGTGALAAQGAKPLNKATTDAASSQAGNKVNELEAAKSKNVAAALAGGSGSLSATATAGPKSVVLGSMLSATLSVRLKTYGLIEFKTDRVKALYVLENDLIPQLTYDTNGLASFDGKPDDLFKTYAGSFGISPDDDVMKAQWIDWFGGRFLPTLLAFATAVKKANKNVDPGNAEQYLTAAQLVDVANATIAAMGKVKDTSISVWKVTTSPFDDQPLNSDSKSCDENITALQNAVKQQVMDQQTAKLANANAKASNGIQAQATAKPNGQVNAQAAAASAGRMNASAGGDSMGAGLGATASTAGANSMAPVGKPIKQPGNGTGGDINKIPLPAPGATGWDAMKPTILAAAQMVGMDPGAMATVASIESGFNPSIKAPTSSATGLFQFTNGTWQSMLAKYGAKYGIDPSTPPTDPRANALLGAEFMKANRDYLKSRLGRDPTDTEVYLAHFLGPGGAAQMLKADPNASAASINPSAAGSNASIFYNNGVPRSVKDVVAVMDKKIRTHAGFDVGMDPGELAAAQKAAKDAANAPDVTATASTSSTAKAPTDAPAGGGGGLPAGNGYASVASSAAAGAATTSAYASTPVPDMNKSSGLAVSAPASSNVISDQDQVVTQQRQSQAVQAAATDAYARQQSDNSNQNLNSVASMAAKQVQLLQTLVDLTRQQTALLQGIHSNTADDGSDDQQVAAAAPPPPSNPRGNRPTVAEAVPAPISLKRGIAVS